MFIDIRKLNRQQVKEILEAAGWAWDDAKSIPGEQNRRDCEALVNEAYKRGFKAGLNAKTQIAAIVAAWDDERPCTCHPDDKPPVPCAKKYALSECKESARKTPNAELSGAELAKRPTQTPG